MYVNGQNSSVVNSPVAFERSFPSAFHECMRDYIPRVPSTPPERRTLSSPSSCSVVAPAPPTVIDVRIVVVERVNVRVVVCRRTEWKKMCREPNVSLFSGLFVCVNSMEMWIHRWFPCVLNTFQVDVNQASSFGVCGFCVTLVMQDIRFDYVYRKCIYGILNTIYVKYDIAKISV